MFSTSLKFKVAIVTINVILLGNSVSGEMPHKVKCLDADVDVIDVCKGRLECSEDFLSPEELKAIKDPKTPPEKFKEVFMKHRENLCILVCQLKTKLKVLNEDGSLNKVEFEKVIDGAFPEAAREGLKTGISKCHEENGMMSKTLKDEGQCESYKPFKECVQNIFATVCKTDPKMFFLDTLAA